jgi:hypothetical protein
MHSPPLATVDTAVAFPIPEDPPTMIVFIGGSMTIATEGCKEDMYTNVMSVYKRVQHVLNFEEKFMIFFSVE